MVHESQHSRAHRSFRHLRESNSKSRHFSVFLQNLDETRGSGVHCLRIKVPHAVFHHMQVTQSGQKHDLAPGVPSLKQLERVAYIAQRKGRGDWHFQLTGGN